METEPPPLQVSREAPEPFLILKYEIPDTQHGPNGAPWEHETRFLQEAALLV
jgi:hypothetical protein